MFEFPAECSFFQKYSWTKKDAFILKRYLTLYLEKILKQFLIKITVITLEIISVQFSSVTQSCPTLCDPMNCSTLGLPVHHQLPELTQTHVHRVDVAIQPSHPLSSPSLPASNSSQHQGLFQWVSSSHQVAKVLVFQLHHQSFQCKTVFSLSSFTFIKRLFGSSLLSVIRVVLSAYLWLLIKSL